MTTRIPTIYKAVFLYFDPPRALWGAFMYYFTRDYALQTFFLEGFQGSRDAAHDLLLYHSGGAVLGSAILNGLLLRYTQDIGVWKFVQAAIVAIDISLLAGIVEVFGKQGRLSPATWQAGDWLGVSITTVVTVVRLAFIAGVGLKEKTKRT
ncbi:uncharacterized protein CTRU02_213131 [Colletotrichum truncatum]|uniref:Uncharacterized protein n=1 Tax=Colletotrichum truncatum TaxID=5467 RepID=A0ACC3YJV8_COLTU|nr:uncharacterized protein CTRU02_03451 [Colletotrichum truncatum]KAF6797420.1 hypothetical protein CTRU02_03451 [Colletotrichum truncatum]